MRFCTYQQNSRFSLFRRDINILRFFSLTFVLSGDVFHTCPVINAPCMNFKREKNIFTFSLAGKTLFSQFLFARANRHLLASKKYFFDRRTGSVWFCDDGSILAVRHVHCSLVRALGRRIFRGFIDTQFARARVHSSLDAP